jgi:hypothetical protein
MNRNQRRAGVAFARATRDEWHPFELVDDIDPRRLAMHIARTGDLRACYRNNVFSVQVFARATEQGEALHLAVRRHDGAEVRGWSDLQRIKNELVDPARTAVELYPPEAEVMDQANMRHIFVLPEGTPAPFSIRGRWA